MTKKKVIFLGSVLITLLVILIGVKLTSSFSHADPDTTNTHNLVITNTTVDNKELEATYKIKAWKHNINEKSILLGGFGACTFNDDGWPSFTSYIDFDYNTYSYSANTEVSFSAMCGIKDPVRYNEISSALKNVTFGETVKTVEYYGDVISTYETNIQITHNNKNYIVYINFDWFDDSVSDRWEADDFNNQGNTLFIFDRDESFNNYDFLSTLGEPDEEGYYTFTLGNSDSKTIPIPEGYEFELKQILPDDWELVSKENDTGTMNGDIDATFVNKMDSYMISTEVVNGNIDNNIEVLPGEDATINYTPHEGYKLKSITVDSNPIDINEYPNSYTFSNVDKDHVIRVEYEEVLYNLKVTTDNNMDSNESFDYKVKMYGPLFGNVDYIPIEIDYSNDYEDFGYNLNYYSFFIRFAVTSSLRSVAINGTELPDLQFDGVDYTPALNQIEQMPEDEREFYYNSISNYQFINQIVQAANANSPITITINGKDSQVILKQDESSENNIVLWVVPNELDLSSQLGAPDTNGYYTLSAKKNKPFTITDLSYGTSYEIIEQEKEGWNLKSKSNDSGTINGDTKAKFTNEQKMQKLTIKLDTNVDTDEEFGFIIDAEKYIDNIDYISPIYISSEQRDVVYYRNGLSLNSIYDGAIRSGNPINEPLSINGIEIPSNEPSIYGLYDPNYNYFSGSDLMLKDYQNYQVIQQIFDLIKSDEPLYITVNGIDYPVVIDTLYNDEEKVTLYAIGKKYDLSSKFGDPTSVWDDFYNNYVWDDYSFKMKSGDELEVLIPYGYTYIVIPADSEGNYMSQGEYIDDKWYVLTAINDANTLTEDMTAEFEYEAQIFRITTSVQHGTIDDSVDVLHGEDVTIHYRPKNGYVLYEISVDGVLVDVDNHKSSYTFSNVDRNHTIIVSYTKDMTRFPYTGGRGTKAFVTIGSIVSLLGICGIIILRKKG